jgi:hypothetical protein
MRKAGIADALLGLLQAKGFKTPSTSEGSFGLIPFKPGEITLPTTSEGSFGLIPVPKEEITLPIPTDADQPQLSSAGFDQKIYQATSVSENGGDMSATTNKGLGDILSEVLKAYNEGGSYRFDISPGFKSVDVATVATPKTSDLITWGIIALVAFLFLRAIL